VFRHPGCNVVVSGANLVKLGRDLVMDYWDDKADDDIVTNKQWVFERYKSFMQSENKMLGKDYRLYFATQGGHCDGCFMPLREGLLIATHYYEDYEMLFPGWKKIILSNPTFRNFRWGNKASHRWHVPGLTAGAHFNEYLEKYCGEWIGNFEETYFEVNILVIDDKNILCIGDENKSNPIVRELKKYGITVHWVPFRTRTFWDGGLHCITLDTIREGTLEDYYPDRGSYGVKTVSSKFFDYSAEKFYAEYSNWLLTGKIIDTN
jgi:hypothetical protein